MIAAATRSVIICIAFTFVVDVARPQAEFLLRVETLQNIADLLNAATPWVSEHTIRNEGSEAMKAKLAEVKSLLDWSGDTGVLLIVNVEEHPNTGITRIASGRRK